MHACQIIVEWLRDSLVGFMLLVAAIVIAGLLTRLFGGQGSPLYMIYLCIGILPFLWFAKKRQVFKGDWWDRLAWAAFIVAISSVPVGTGGRLGRWPHTAFVVVSMFCFGWIYQTIRRRLARSTTKNDTCA